MKIHFALLALFATAGVPNCADEPVRIIFDTDITGDVDDVLALAMLHALADRNECTIEAVTVSKINPLTASFVDAVKEHKPQVLGMSALLTTTMPKMEETIEALKEAGVRDQVKIMAGGAPVTQDFIDKIGADAYGANAAAASEKAKALLA